MKVVCIGGGPGGLYAAILIKNSYPDWHVEVHERNQADDTFGFGVVFSDATLGNLKEADAPVFEEIKSHFAYWDRIDIFRRSDVMSCGGNGFCGLSRKTLLEILQRRASELGAVVNYESDVTPEDFPDADLIIAADGIGSRIRSDHSDDFQPSIGESSNRFVWLGTTFPYEAFTFYFKNSADGLFRIHAYRYEEGGSTFIAECTEDTWRAAGLDATSEDETIAYLETLFSDELAGHRLIKNKSIWRQFSTISNKRWSSGNIALLGDAVHTAHFSIGSGTKLAMEDAIALAESLRDADSISDALIAYEKSRQPEVESLQDAAAYSLEWFHDTEQYIELPMHQFCASLMMRSMRVTFEKIRQRDPLFAAAVEKAMGGNPADTPVRIKNQELAARDIILVETDSLSSFDITGRKPGAVMALHYLLNISDEQAEFLQAWKTANPDTLLGLKTTSLQPLSESALQRLGDLGVDWLEVPDVATDKLLGLRQRWTGLLSVSVKIDGLTSEELLGRCLELSGSGFDAVTLHSNETGKYLPSHVADAARRVKHKCDTAVIVSPARTLDDVATVVASGRADAAMMLHA